MPLCHTPSGNRQKGLILVEVLIAGLILVLGVGSLVAAQRAALKAVTNAEASSLLVDLHGSIVDWLRLHPDGARAGQFDIELFADPAEGSGNSTRVQSPRLRDILATLHNTGAQHYLKIRCNPSQPSHCQICVGLSRAIIGGQQSSRGEPPLDKLCSQQHIL